MDEESLFLRANEDLDHVGVVSAMRLLAYTLRCALALTYRDCFFLFSKAGASLASDLRFRIGFCVLSMVRKSCDGVWDVKCRD